MADSRDAMTRGSPEAPEAVVVQPSTSEARDEGGASPEQAVQQPAKVMRIGAMVRQLLDEVRSAPLDEASRSRLREIYETSVKELRDVLSPELRDELERLSLRFDEDAPSGAELRVAHAQLVGWLEGLFHGIQAMLFAQEMQSRAQLEELRRRGLPTPQQQGEGRGPGTYL